MGELIFRSPVHLSEFKLSAAKLTKAFIDSAPAGVYSDPATPCLRLRVRPGKDGAKQRAWILRRTVAGKRYDVGLGNLETVPLARARLAAAELNSLSDDDFIGRLEEKRAGRRKKAEAKPATAVTFAKACELFAEWNVRMGVWEDWGKTHRVFESRMRLHVLPTLGAMPLTDITPKIVVSMAEKIWEHADLVNRCLIYTKQVSTGPRRLSFARATTLRTAPGRSSTCCPSASTSSSTTGPCRWPSYPSSSPSSCANL